MKEFKNLITLTQISDGAPGPAGESSEGYYIESNQQEILCFYEEENRIITPETLEISLYKTPLNDESQKLDFSSSYKFGYIDKNENFVSLINEEYAFFYSIGIENDGQIENGTENTLFYNLQSLFNLKSESGNYIFETDILLKFAYLQNGEEIAIKIIPFSLGVSEDMAKFNIEATKINMAIRDSYLQFDSKGLSLYVSGKETDAGLKIYKKTTEEDGSETSEKVFWADENGNLNLKGHIEAQSGSFTGTIHATDATFDKGEIGGFIIEEDRLVSTDEDIPSIILDGKEGIIEAKKIKLGANATIESYIQLGKAYLYNPDSPEGNGTILRSGDISVTQDGHIFLGDIQLNGNESKIYGNNWSITPDYAEFNNVVVSGSIETAVFKQATTQAIGSAMLFMQSYKIENIDKNVITVDQMVEDKISPNTLVWLVNNNSYVTYTVQSIAENKITLDIPDDIIVNATALIVIGQKDDKPLIFGINGGNSKVADNLIYQRGLTINEYDNSELPHLFLGDLTALNSEYSSDYVGYGLYSDNVYLNGSLTTKVGENSYAGVNTLSGVYAKAFSSDYVNKVTPTEVDESKIVFWAGASSVSANDVQDAYFQVTEQGSVFASRAKLSNSLIVGGEIYGSDLYAARIHGTGEKNEPALTIYDTAGGISFKTNYNNDEQSSGLETFSIQNNGLRVGDDRFIAINNSEVTFIGSKLKTKGDTNYISITTIDNIPVLYHEHSPSKTCGFYFDEGATIYKLTSNNQDNIKTIWAQNDTKFLGTISFAKDKNDTSFQYRPVSNGYDLYIIDKE